MGALVTVTTGGGGGGDMGERPFQMGADDGIHAVLVQPGAQIDIGSLKLCEQRPPPQFKMIQFASIHGLVSSNGCLDEWTV